MLDTTRCKRTVRKDKEFVDEDHFGEVCGFAEQIGLMDQLNGTLDYLGANREDRRLVLYWDFAPHSFAFVLEGKGDSGEWRRLFNGGIIYQGPDSPADGSFPSLTVSLNNNRVGWFSHT